MNGPWCSSESALRGTQNTCASLNCHLPALAFLGEQPSFSFQCLSSENHPAMLRRCSLHLFLHVLGSTRCPFPRQPVKGEALRCDPHSWQSPPNIQRFCTLLFPFLWWLLYINKIFHAENKKKQSCYIASVSGGSKSTTGGGNPDHRMPTKSHSLAQHQGEQQGSGCPGTKLRSAQNSA